jgi:hypothetical protein
MVARSQSVLKVSLKSSRRWLIMWCFKMSEC